jgi:Patatin-like phospholipase
MTSPCHFIDPVPPAKLWEASGQGRMDESSRQIRDFEWRSYIQERRRQYNNSLQHHGAAPLPYLGSNAPDDLTGIALSGGGVRSATFALGVLQALARHDLLHRFDYLSTVSGGGYIGTSLTWLTSRLVADHARAGWPERGQAEGEIGAPSLPAAGFGLRPSDPDEAFGARSAAGAPAPFPYGTDDPRTARQPVEVNATDAMLRHLRQHGNYLTPGEGITLPWLTVVLLRLIILNLLVWIPIVAAVMWLLIWPSMSRVPDSLLQWVPVSAIEFARSIHPSEWAPPPLLELVEKVSPPLRSDVEASTKFFSFGLMIAAAIYLFVACVVAFDSYSLATWLSHKSGRWSLGGTKYRWRRKFERWMRVPFWAIGVLLLLASVPFVAAQLQGWLLGPSFSIIGLASGLLAFSPTLQHPKRSWIGAASLLYGVLLVSYLFGLWAAQGSPVLGIPAFYVLATALVLAIVTGWAVDLNQNTIHNFYRDRLMEAFLPDVDKALRNETGAAWDADSTALSRMCDPGRAVGPYHIINTNVVLTKSPRRTYRLRGGDSFILSPLYCGSNATGWRPTKYYMGDELTLPTAMAISGAPANPWTASGGGVIHNRFVGRTMELMNLRLGFWAPNPNLDRRRSWSLRSSTKSFRPNYFDPSLKQVLGTGLRENAPVCLLSDAGDFENLGLYELIRRRLRLIVLCDGTADPNYDFVDLQKALERIGADFGARVEFDKETTLQRFMPSIDAVYPRDVRLSESAYAIAQIIYADGRTGHLVYLTTALCKGLRLKLLSYKALNRDFPDQPTADQSFDEEQFEAYRELGYVIADGFIRHDMQNGGMLGQSIRTRFYPQAAE